MFMCLLLEYFSLASIFWHIYTQFWVVELNAPKNERSCGNEWKKKCQIICIYELWLFLDCSGCSNHHFDYLFQWQHKWFTLLQPFPYIFIHFCLFCFCFCFYFYFLYMRVFMPICRSFVHPLIPISLSPRKKHHAFAFIQLRRWQLLLCDKIQKPYAHTQTRSHIYLWDGFEMDECSSSLSSSSSSSSSFFLQTINYLCYIIYVCVRICRRV